MKQLNENFKRINEYKPSYSKNLLKEDDEPSMVDKLENLVMTGNEANIDLAFELVGSQGEDVSEELFQRFRNTFIDVIRDWSNYRDEIKSFFRKKILQLSKKTEIPEIYFKHPNLERIRFRYGNMPQLDPRIGDIKSLKELTITHSNLQSIPDSIGDLHNLSILVLNNNDIKELPESIGNLSSALNPRLSSNSFKSELKFKPASHTTGVGNLTFKQGLEYLVSSLFKKL